MVAGLADDALLTLTGTGVTRAVVVMMCVSLVVVAHCFLATWWRADVQDKLEAELVRIVQCSHHHGLAYNAARASAVGSFMFISGSKGV